MPAGAQEGASLVVAPTRIVFEGEARAAAVNLLNAGTRAGTYRIRFVQRRMREDGGFEAITGPGPGELFADRLVRFAPQRVVLTPGQHQTVRLVLQKPADLQPGEYRSHLLFFQAVAPDAAGGGLQGLVAEPEGSGEAGGVHIRLTPVFGISIPVIVRHGRTTASVTLSHFQWEEDRSGGRPAALQLRINRTGNRSVYGDLTVSLIRAGGREQVIGVVKGVAVYTPSPFRLVRVPLAPSVGPLPGGAVLRVTYRDAEGPGKRILARTETTLP